MTKANKKGDDTLKVKDTGRRKVTIKTSNMRNDSAGNYSYSKVVEKPKKGVFKSTAMGSIDSTDSKRNNTYNDYTLTKKDTPKRSSVFSNTSSGVYGGDAPLRRTDSIYVQKIRKPTEKREGKEVTKIKKTDNTSPNGFMGLLKPTINIKTVKKTPKLSSNKKK